jgi:hypothetical protein
MRVDVGVRRVRHRRVVGHVAGLCRWAGGVWSFAPGICACRARCTNRSPDISDSEEPSTNRQAESLDVSVRVARELLAPVHVGVSDTQPPIKRLSGAARAAFQAHDTAERSVQFHDASGTGGLMEPVDVLGDDSALACHDTIHELSIEHKAVMGRQGLVGRVAERCCHVPVGAGAY